MKKVQGTADISLNERGRELARVTGEALKEVPFDLAISSPLKRALETARLVLGDREVPIYTDRRIQEISFGEMEGTSLLEGAGGEFAVRAMLQRFYRDDLGFWHGKVPPNCSVNIIEAHQGQASLTVEDMVLYNTEK